MLWYRWSLRRAKQFIVIHIQRFNYHSRIYLFVFNKYILIHIWRRISYSRIYLLTFKRCIHLHSTVSIHSHSRAKYWFQHGAIISERNMADEGRTIIWRGRKKTTTRQTAQTLQFILCPALTSSELDKYSISQVVLGKQRWRSGESPRQCGPGSLPDPQCVEFVVGSRLAPWVFLWGLRFSLVHKKPASPNSNSTRIEGLHEDQLMWLPL